MDACPQQCVCICFLRLAPAPFLDVTNSDFAFLVPTVMTLGSNASRSHIEADYSEGGREAGRESLRGHRNHTHMYAHVCTQMHTSKD